MTQNNFRLSPGVAPDALLYALKVFGSDSEDTTSTAVVNQALEWALDPNEDFDFSDRLDVVNLSLGTPFGISDSFTFAGLPIGYNDAINALINEGSVVVCSAGNSGNTSFITSAPATIRGTIAVANSYSAGIAHSAIEVLAPEEELIASLEATFTPPLSETGPVEADVVLAEPILGCEPLTNAAEVAGNLVLIERGNCLFTEKIQAAQDAGAVGVIIYNNRDSNTIVGMGFIGDAPTFTIPAVSIGELDGRRLSQAVSQGLRIRLGSDATINPTGELIDTLNPSSSRGPVGDNVSLKPDVAAPGSFVTSAAAALMMEQRPTWTPEEIKAAMMNTSVPMADPQGYSYPLTRSGAGRVDVATALATQTVGYSVQDKGAVSLSFGAKIVSETSTFDHRFKIANKSNTPNTYNLSIETRQDNPGAFVSLSQNTLILDAGEDIELIATLHLEPTLIGPAQDFTSNDLFGSNGRVLPAEISGFVHIESDLEEIRIPYYATFRAAYKDTLGTTRFGIPRANPSSFPPIPLSTRIHLKPENHTSGKTPLLLSFNSYWDDNFYCDSNFNSEHEVIRNFGLSLSELDNDGKQYLDFVIVTEDTWVAPQRAFVSLEIDVDVSNSDADFTIAASNRDYIITGDSTRASDIFRTALRADNEDSWRDVGPLNRSVPNFFSNILQLSVPLEELPWFDPDSSIGFSCEIRIDSLQSGPGRPAEQLCFSSWPDHVLSYSAKGSPFELQTTLPVYSDRLLVIHPQNAPEHVDEVLSLNFFWLNDADRDGMDDRYEEQHFGSTVAAHSGDDSDRDGRDNLTEYLEGTDPLDAGSVFIPELAQISQSGTNLQFTAQPDRLYQLQHSIDLTNFEDIGQPVMTPVIQPLSLPIDFEDEAGFYRLKTTLP